MAKHRYVATDSPHGLRRTLAAVGVFTSAIALALALTGGTYALWNTTLSVMPPTTITAGNASLVVTTPLVMPQTPLYPGLTIYGSEIVSNTGTIALSTRGLLTAPAVTTAYSGALTVALATASSATNCSTGIVTSAWSPATFAAPAIAVFGAPIAAASQNNVICVSLTLASNAAADAQGGTLSDLALTVTGFQS